MPLSRRQVLVTAAAATIGVAVGGCDRRPGRDHLGPSSAAVQATEARRRRAGTPVRQVALTAAPVTLELAGRPVPTWAYNGSVPGPEVRVTAGEVLRARLDNRLPEATTIHWHGVALRNNMDGVPDVTQPPVQPGGQFTYEFTVPAPGTYFFHPHVGVQLDRGLYAALVVDDPDEPGRYDREAVVVLDDWTDGLGPAPAAILASLQRSGGISMDDMMGAMTRGSGGPLAGVGGEVNYPRYLLNGRPPEDPATLAARPGQRLRLRLINAAADTAFRVALGGHRLQVTHSDGYPLDPVTVDALVLAMGERYDLLVDLDEGVFPLVAVAEGKRGQARGLLRAGRGTPPPARARPAELDGRLLDPARLRADPAVALPPRPPDRTHRLTLSGGMGEFRWMINGRTFDPDRPLPLRGGERTRLVLENPSMMFHPMHLHGHTFAVQHPSGAGPRKDTVIVTPMQRLAVDLDADNPGHWVVHCHNLYHMEAGMMTSLAYLA